MSNTFPFLVLLFCNTLHDVSCAQTLNICTSGDCNLVDDGSILVCTKTANSCTVTISGTDSGGMVYSAAPNTHIYCTGLNGCRYGEYHCGNELPPNYATYGLSSSDFNGTINDCYFDCTDGNAYVCCDANFYCEGDVAQCRVSGSGGVSFWDSTLFCSDITNPSATCSINCPCCVACDRSVMQCTDTTAVCSQTGSNSAGLNIVTSSPTTQSISPSKTPTTAPTMIFDRYASQNEQMNCSTATSNDICNLYCDVFLMYAEELSCGNAGECNVYCSDRKCITGTINGTNVNKLTVISTYSECMLSMDIYVPNNGNAYFISPSSPGFNNVRIHGGSNTNEVVLNATGGGFFNTVINGQTVNYVKVIVGLGGFFTPVLPTPTQGSTIYCPQNSNYQPASCVMDASGGGDVSFVNIYSQRGMPYDVELLYGGGVWNAVNLICDYGNMSNISASIPTSGICYYTTAAPTSESVSPTMFPTANPSTNPSTNPTSNPTSNPSADPSTTPTSNPSANPSVNPTVTPIVSASEVSASEITLTIDIEIENANQLSAEELNDIVGDIINLDNINNVEIISVNSNTIVIIATTNVQLDHDQINNDITDALDDTYPEVEVNVNFDSEDKSSSSSESSDNTIVIILAILIPVLLISMGVAFVILFVLKRKRMNKEENIDTAQSMQLSSINSMSAMSGNNGNNVNKTNIGPDVNINSGKPKIVGEVSFSDSNNDSMNNDNDRDIVDEINVTLGMDSMDEFEINNDEDIVNEKNTPHATITGGNDND